MSIRRIGKHLLEHHWRVRRVFPPKVLTAIEQAIKLCEATHSGQIRFVVDGALDGGSDASGYTWAASNDIGVLLWAWATWDKNNGNGNPGGASAYYNYMMANAPWAAGHSAPTPAGGTFGQSVLTH